MKQQQFEARYRGEWLAFEQALEVLQGKKANRDAARETLANFPEQYRRLCHQYALARERGYGLPLIQQLNKHDQQINAWLTSRQITTGTLSDFLATHADAGLQHTYQDFLARLQRCQQASERNARLLAHNQHSTRHLLDLLRNQGESTQNVYDRQGLTRGQGGQRVISKA